MPSLASTVVLALLLVAAVIMVLLWSRRRRSSRPRVHFAICRALQRINPPLGRDHRRRSLHDKLTEREIQVARLVAQGRHNKEIARELNIADHTVESHIRSIYEKLDVHSRVDLTREIHDLFD